jgi:DNA-binding transcriptional MerR regulator
MSSPEELLSIGEVVKATGLTESTLRAWEQRHGFPAPEREPSGHRRYSAKDVEDIRAVIAQRTRGISLGQAIEQVGSARSASSGSFFATLRERHPSLQPVRATKRHLLALAQSIEEESTARAEPALLIGGFQREGFYRASEARWQDLARGAAAAFVLADFKRARRPRGGPTEVPLADHEPALREWVLICLAPEHGVCMVGWEPPGSDAGEDRRRQFELLYSLRPAVVRDATRVALSIAARKAPRLAEGFAIDPDEIANQSAESQVDLSAAITARLLSKLG